MTNNADKNYLFPLVVIAGLFFLFGFITWLNGALIPLLEIVCQLTSFQALFVAFSFYIAYTIMAIPSSLLLLKIGYKQGIVAGLGIMAIGAFVFIPAAMTINFFLFLIGLFILGSGLTLLQSAVNPYIVLLGPANSAAKRISIMGVLNKTAGVLAPLLLTAYVFSDTRAEHYTIDYLAGLSIDERGLLIESLSNRLIAPYLGMTAFLVFLMLVLKAVNLPEIKANNEKNDADIKFKDIRRFPHTIYGAFALFVGIGAEVIAGDTIGSYGRHLQVDHFSTLTSYTLAFMVLGYIAGIALIPKYLTQHHALALSSVLGIIFTVGIVFSSSNSSVFSENFYAGLSIPVIPNTVLFLALLGFANAMVWPTIWPLALNGLGPYTSIGSGLLIMSIAGGALLPLVYGKLAQLLSDPKLSYVILLPCYLIILHYALRGRRINP